MKAAVPAVYPLRLEAGNMTSSMKACNYEISSLSFAHMNCLEDVWISEVGTQLFG